MKNTQKTSRALLSLSAMLLFVVAIVFTACKDDEVNSSEATVTALTCSSATFSATATSGSSYSGTATIPYTGGNGNTYAAGSAISSTGVTGLSATLASGTLASGAGNITFSISGTPASSGTASFAISFGGQSCSVSLTVASASTTVSTLTCSSATFSATATSGSSYSGTATIPYTGGNGTSYSAGSAISSTGVTGLSATLASGTLASGAGNVTFNISGTPASSGTASFAISFGGQSCTLSLTVSASSSTADCSTLSGVEKIVCLADAFKATLSSSQVSTVQLSYTFSNIKTWSNLPAAMSARLGIKLGSLSSTQLAAANAIIQEISGTTANEGWDEVEQLLLADDYLLANGGGSTYGAGNYYLAFFGTPATTGTFEIMMTGHHKTVANTYKNNAMIGATPHFAAIEPVSFTTSGVTYAPISQERDAFVALLAALSDTEKATAKSSSTFSDILLPPGKEWQFPTTYSGLQCSGLTSNQKALVLEVIKTYVNDVDDTNAATILATYTAELDNTYITYSGTTAVNTKNDYFRIDGPHVWIEFSVPNGVILSGVHFHSIWRDRVTDYGGTKN